jgi:hypothetical protein
MHSPGFGRAKPVDRIGYSIDIYDLRDSAAKR